MRMQFLARGRSLFSSFSLIKEKVDERKAFRDRRAAVNRAYFLVAVLTAALGASYATYIFETKNQAAQVEGLVNLRLDNFRQEMRSELRKESQKVEATAGVLPDMRGFKQEFAAEMGLVPIDLLRQRAQSFVELNSYEDPGLKNYGTAGYLGHGYFITVKHAVVAIGDGQKSRHIQSVKIRYKGKEILARVVDVGDAKFEVDPGDWAILKVNEPLDLPALTIDLAFSFVFADPIFRLGNDYSQGVIPAAGYVGQRTANGLVTSLTDGHPGVSGGGVLDRQGDLVGIPVGRMMGDFRFSFILPLRKEMFRKVPHLRN